ncbi:MAG: hypothetical protein JJU02_05485 [Cryomorphaceae bacterium]|nr:hypothetical protein [Cryomorphaceae bacterium]
MSKQNQSLLLIVSLVVLGIFSRFIPHPPNATAIGAVAIFGGFAFRNKLLAFGILFISLFISDLLINNVVYGSLNSGFVWFTGGFGFIYAGFALSILLGIFLKSGFTISRLGGAFVSSVLVFFLLTNFGAWLSLPLYPKTFSGLLTAYAAGIPFALNQLLFTMIYGVVLFGAFGLFTKKYPAIA